MSTFKHHTPIVRVTLQSSTYKSTVISDLISIHRFRCSKPPLFLCAVLTSLEDQCESNSCGVVVLTVIQYRCETLGVAIDP